MAYKPVQTDLHVVLGEQKIQDGSEKQPVGLIEPFNDAFDSKTDDKRAATSCNDAHLDQNGDGVIVYSQPLSKWFKAVRYGLTVLAFAMVFFFLAAAVTIIGLTPSCNEKLGELEWWKTTVIYQCYPRSFKDSNGDGSGDLTGIISKVDFLHNLLVETVWLNPIFKSPQKDNGYDISDYKDIDPLYGTMTDLKLLMSELHKRGMHLVLDFVPNHTSDKHKWFIESRSSLNSSKRDWYIWANANDNGGPPNNWLSLFGGSAWSFDNHTNQYYLHQFSEFQPDLNYHNAKVRYAMEDVMKFWFDLGVDGFRIDAIIFLLEDPDLRDEPINPNYDMDKFNCSMTNYSNPDCYNSLIHMYTKDYTGIHSIIKNWRKLADSFTGSSRFLIGEVFDPVDVVMTYYGTNNNELNLPFNFLLLSNTNWTGDGVSKLVSMWMDALPEGAWPNWVLGNHDFPRIANKAGNYLARALNVLLLTLPGTSTTYYGEEIFMTDVYVPPPKRQDIYQDRDKARTPMQWDNSTNAGFTNGKADPWLPVATNYSMYNVDIELSNTSSMLSLYKRLVKLITTHDAFRFADYNKVLSTRDLFAFHRFHNGTKKEYVVVVNFSRSNATANLTSIKDSFLGAIMELSSAGTARDGSDVDLTKIQMEAGEAVVINGCSIGNC